MAQNRRGSIQGHRPGSMIVEKANDFKRYNKKVNKRLSVKI